MSAVDTLIVLAKYPEPGRVKTRLCPPFTAAQASSLAAASLRDTLDAADRVPARRRVLCFDREPGAWRRPGWDSVRQVDGGLDTRLTAALHSATGPTVLIGMDTPQVRAAHLRFAAEHYDACLGLASDGGYWAIGLREPHRAGEVVPGVPMSHGCTGRHQLRRLRRAGLRVQLLPALTDIDTAETAHEVAALVPHGEFARELASVTAGPASAGSVGTGFVGITATATAG